MNFTRANRAAGLQVSMDYADLSQFGIGALLGLSAAPHCLVMCSGIATALALAGPSGAARSGEAFVRGLLSNSGRIASYAIAGAIVAGAGVSALSWLDASLANITLRWLAAILLSMVGLSLIGIMPSIVVSTPSRMMARLAGSGGCGSRRSHAASFAGGVAWGFMPCVMAYSALFYAAMSGSPLRGALTMTGFGLATLVAMLLPAFGISALSRFVLVVRAKIAFGVLLAVIGLAGILNAAHDFGVWCRA